MSKLHHLAGNDHGEKPKKGIARQRKGNNPSLPKRGYKNVKGIDKEVWERAAHNMKYLERRRKILQEQAILKRDLLREIQNGKKSKKEEAEGTERKGQESI